MNWLDIVIAAIIILATLNGLREGLIRQLSGLVGLFLGVYFAYRWAGAVAERLPVDGETYFILGFVIVLVVFLVGFAVLGHALRKVIKFAGLGFIDRAGGMAVAFLKSSLITGLILYGIVSIDFSGTITEKIDESKLSSSLISATEKSFPYLGTIKDAVFNDYDDHKQEHIPPSAPNHEV